MAAASVLATVAVLRRGDRQGGAMLDVPNR
jgi:hypothetical protein